LVLHKDPTTKIFDGVKIQFLPWIIDNAVVDESADIILCHAEMKDFQVVKNFKATHGLSKDIFKDKIVYSGHYHIAQKSGKIQYLGNSFIQADWNDFKEKKGFYVLDTTSMESEFIESTCTPKHIKCYIDSEAKTVAVEGFGIDETFKLDSKFDYDMFKNHKLKIYATKELAIVKKFIEQIDLSCYSYKLEIQSEIEEIDISERIEKARDYSIDDKIIEVVDESDKTLTLDILREAKSMMKEVG
jgi:hypothetical protein